MGAAAILQDYLNKVAAAVMADDWATYRDGISLPCAMISRETSVIIATEADLRAGFDAFRSMLKGQNVSGCVMTVEKAHFLDKDLISGYYMSHVMMDGHRVIPPFRSLLDLRMEGHRWRAAAVTNGLSPNQWPVMRVGLPAALDRPRVAEGTEE